MDNTEQAANPPSQNVREMETKEEFDKIISEANKKTTILVEFFADWCSTCKQMADKLEEWAVQYEGKLIIIKVNVDKVEDVANMYEVSNLPTFVFLRDKKQIDSFVGSKVEKVEEGLTKHCGQTTESVNQPTTSTRAPPPAATQAKAKPPSKK